MTTIAYNPKEGVIACDSRQSQGDTIISDNSNKHIVEKGVHFFMSGNVPDQQPLIDLYFKRDVDIPFSHFSINAIVVDGGKVYKLGVNGETGLWKCPADHIEALGSGADHALTAMDMGATAKEAIKWAIKRDSRSGGRIRTFKIND